MDVQYLLFDFNGTLARSKPMVIEIFNQLAATYGFDPMQPEEIDELSKLSIMERAKRLRVPLYLFPLLRMEYKALYKKMLPHLQVEPGVAVMLEQLKQKAYRLSIVSSHKAEHIHTFLHQNQLDCFDSVHSSKDWFGKHRTIQSVVRKSGIPAEKILYFGDEIRDIQACHKAGVRMVAVGWGYDDANRLAQEGPAYLIHRPEEIWTVLG